MTDERWGDAPPKDGLSWRELAVARSLDSARVRAENRVQRFVNAALESINAGSGPDFTVQEVVERSGQSLRSFYQYFDGKHQLLLTLFEESVASTADLLAEKLAAEEPGVARLHCFVLEYHRLCRPAPAAADDRTRPLMAEFAQQLLTEYPREAARAFQPLVVLLEEVLESAADAGAVRGGLGRSVTAGVILEAIMFNAFSATIAGVAGGDDEAAEELWTFVLHGVAAPATGQTAPGAD